MDLRQVEYFLAVVDHASTRRAAAALHVAQPSVAQGIRTLEQELGTQLFHRIGRRLVLSPAGKEFVRPARQILRDVSTVHSVVADALGPSRGRLDLVAEPALSVDPVAPLIGAFRRRKPGVTVRLVEPPDEAMLTTMLRDGDGELGFAYLPQPAAGLEVREAGVHEMFLVFPPGAALDGNGPVALHELSGLPMVVVPKGSAQRDFFDRALAAAGARPRLAVQTAHREAIVPMVLAGAGATLLPRTRAEEAARRGAVIRPIDPPISRPIGVLHRPGLLSPAARAFLETIGASAA